MLVLADGLWQNTFLELLLSFEPDWFHLQCDKFSEFYRAFCNLSQQEWNQLLTLYSSF